jgi:hypothetical protein
MKEYRLALATRGLVAALAAFALLAHPGRAAAQYPTEPTNPIPHGSIHHRGGGAGVGIAIGIGAAVAIGAAIVASQAAASNAAETETTQPQRQTQSSQSNTANRPSLPPPRFSVARGESRFVPNEVLVEVTNGVSADEIAAIERRAKLVRLSTETFELAGRTIYHYRIPDGATVPAMLAKLSRERRIVSAQPNFRFTTPRATFKLAEAVGSAAGAIDPALLYVVRSLRLAEAHQVARGDQVRVAVIDSTVDTTHPELSGAVLKSLDVTGLATPASPHSHGTGMAGAVAAHARLVGVAPAAALLAITAFRPEGEGADGTTVSVLRGLDAALAEGARVVNMSFAGPKDALLTRALASAHARGLILVAAAGNAGPQSPPLYPAADPNVIAVTATDADDKVFDQANRGSYVTIAAPGVDVLVAAPGGAYAFTSGTSVATAHVSGVIALMLAREPTLTADAVRRALVASARDLGPRGRDDVFGAGEADADAALKRLAPRTAGAPINR